MALRKSVSHMLQTRPAKQILYELCEQAEHALGAYEMDFTAFTDDQAPNDPGEVILIDAPLNNDDDFADQTVTHHQVAHTPIKKEEVLWDNIDNLYPMAF